MAPSNAGAESGARGARDEEEDDDADGRAVTRSSRHVGRLTIGPSPGRGEGRALRFVPAEVPRGPHSPPTQAATVSSVAAADPAVYAPPSQASHRGRSLSGGGNTSPVKLARPTQATPAAENRTDIEYRLSHTLKALVGPAQPAYESHLRPAAQRMMPPLGTRKRLQPLQKCGSQAQSPTRSLPGSGEPPEMPINLNLQATVALPLAGPGHSQPGPLASS
jgi:hypothetical protein